MTAIDESRERLAAFLGGLDCPAREVAAGEWGIELEAGGFRLDVGISIRGPMVRAIAAVLPAGVIDPHQLLYWNRQAPFVCFAENLSGEVFVSGELPLSACDDETLDTFLGLLLASATRAREFAIEQSALREGADATGS